MYAYVCVCVCLHEPELAVCCVLLVGRLAGDRFGDRKLNGRETVSVFPCLGDFSGFLRRGFPGGHNSETLACWQLVIQNASVAPRKRLLPPAHAAARRRRASVLAASPPSLSHSSLAAGARIPLRPASCAATTTACAVPFRCFSFALRCAPSCSPLLL